MKEQIEIAAKWWADQLRAGTKQDNGDFMQSALATVLTHPEDPQKVNLFEQALKDLLPEHLSKCWDTNLPGLGSYLRCLACDYHPEEALAEAAKIAGIPATCPPFPMKTVMWVNPDSVKVKHGYRAEIQYLFGKQKEETKNDT